MPAQAPRRRGGKIYLLLWLLLAAGAVVYLGALTLSSGPLTALLSSPKPATSEPNDVAEGPTTIELQAKLNGLYWDARASRLYLTDDDAGVNAIKTWDGADVRTTAPANTTSKRGAWPSAFSLPARW